MVQVQAKAGMENDNDLTAIKGIGPARQQWFKEALNVATFEDLAALSADEVEVRFKAEGRIASRGEIEDWIAQARLRVEEKIQEAPAKAPGNNNPSQKQEAAPKADGWKPIASFIVEFRERQLEGQAAENQTSAHHLETDTNQTWPGLEKKQLCQWMVDQIPEEKDGIVESNMPVVKAPAPKRAPVTKKIPAELRVKQVQVYQPPDSKKPVASGKAWEAFDGMVRAQTPFSLEATCELSGPGADEAMNGERKYQALFFASEQPGPDVLVGDSQPDVLTAGQSSYAAVLPEVILQPGLYHLRVVAKIEGAARLGYAQIGGLQVR